MTIFPEDIPSFATERLLIRPLQAEYLPFLEEVWAATVGPPMGKARSRAIFTLLTDLFTNRQGICWVMVERTSGQVIGTCEFHNFDSAGGRTDIGCEQLPEYQKQGYMTEALTELLDYAFNTLGLVELVARIHPENIASVALFSRLGFEEAKGVQAGGFLRLVARGDTGMDDYGWL